MSTQSNSTVVKGKILTYCPATNTNEFMDYTERSVHTEHGKMYRICTSCGYEITVTDDHSLATNGSETFFAPLPPQDALGKFVPIMRMISYIPKNTAQAKAMRKFARDNFKPNKFSYYMLNLSTDDLGTALLAMVHFDTTDNTENPSMYWEVKDKQELELAKVILARQGIFCKIVNTRLYLDYNAVRIPENGALVQISDVAKVNPANPYLNLPYVWDEVTSVEEVDREEITYDFTVPEFPLFIANGILVYDTMQLHVPATEEARLEALEKMTPSHNLFSPRNMGPMMLPQQESVFGLFAATKTLPTFDKSTRFTPVQNVKQLHENIRMGMIKPDAPVQYRQFKTTAGAVLINELFPMPLRNYDKVWNKSVMSGLLTQVGQRWPKEYTRIADGLKELGALFAYRLGVSYKATDFDMDELKKKRNVYFNKIDQELADVDKRKDLTPKQVDAEKGKILRKAQAFAQKLTDEATDNTFQQWAYTGSKGSKGQVMQIITSPTVVADPKDKLIPSLIHTSYNEGLSPADYFVSSYGTRKGTVGAKLSVAPAGALAKELIGNVLDIVVTKKDCGCKRGLVRDINDTKNIINRVEAKTNKFIDANYYEQLKRRGVTQVEVRSPATCEAHDGVCQYCYGYNEKLKFPDIGENVGVVSAHAISEPFTQLGLSSKHTAGTAAGDAIGFNTVKAFFNMSTKFSGAAVITEVSGTITNIQAAPAGGQNVYIGRKKYYIPPTRTLKVKVGDRVEAGDPLTDGILNISKVVPYKGIDTGRKQFIQSLDTLYHGAGLDSVKKNFEVIARGLINYVQITDPGDFDDLIEGDVVDYNQLAADIRKNPSKRPPKFVPFQKGTNKAPTYKHDWMANFGFKYLKEKLIDNAATQSRSPLHSYNPIPSYARGTGFGKGKDGRY